MFGEEHTKGLRGIAALGRRGPESAPLPEPDPLSLHSHRKILIPVAELSTVVSPGQHRFNMYPSRESYSHY